MGGATLYGVLLAVVMLTLEALSPPPGGWLVFWLAITTQMTVASIIVWRRTALPLATAGIVSGAIMSTVFAVAATRGVVYADLLRAYPLEAIAVFVLLPFLSVQEYCRHLTQWTRWREHSEHCPPSTF